MVTLPRGGYDVDHRGIGKRRREQQQRNILDPSAESDKVQQLDRTVRFGPNDCSLWLVFVCPLCSVCGLCGVCRSFICGTLWCLWLKLTVASVCERGDQRMPLSRPSVSKATELGVPSPPRLESALLEDDSRA